MSQPDTPDHPTELESAPGADSSGVDSGKFGGRIGSRRVTLAAALLLTLLFGLLCHGALKVGPTYDEHFYIASGYAYWQEGDFALNREHPPLLKLLAGLPLLALDDIEFRSSWREVLNYPVSFFFHWNGSNLDRNLFLARLPFCLLTTLLAWVAFVVARRWFGDAAGLAALLLLGFHPSLMAHGRLAALDAGTAAFLFFAALAGLRAFERPAPSSTLAAGALFGLACLTKFTALLLVPLFCVLALYHACRRRSWLPLGRVALIFGAGLGVFAGGYGFEFRSVNSTWNSPFLVVPKESAETDALTAEQLVGRLRTELPAQVELPGEWIALDSQVGVLRALARALDSGDSVLGEASAGVLEGLADARSDVRQAAFGALLDGGPGSEDRRLGVLRTLADANFASMEAARAWWSRYAGEDWDRTVFNRGWIRALTRGIFGDDRPIPLVSALAGLDKQLVHSQKSHVTSFRGELLEPAAFAAGNPHPEYYSVVMAVKSPPALWLLWIVGCVSMVVRRRGVSLPFLLVLVAFPVLVFAMFSGSRLLMGIKYVLPVLPFVAVLAARAATVMPRLTVALAAVAALEGVALQPHQLMYYNWFAGGPSGGPDITVIGDDWGQDVRAVGRFYARNRDAIRAAGGLYYDPYTVGPPSAFGLEEARTPYANARGIVAVGLADLSRRPVFYAWLKSHEPIHRLGWSVLIFDTRLSGDGGAELTFDD